MLPSITNKTLQQVAIDLGMENALGTTFPLVIDEVVSKQLFKAHTAELLPGGDYKLVVKSRAGDAAGPLQTSFRKVKYLRVVDPAPHITDTFSSDGVETYHGQMISTSPFSIVGEHLANATITAKLFDSEGAELPDTYPVEGEGVTVADDLIWLSYDKVAEIGAPIIYNGRVTLTVTTPNGNDSVNVGCRAGG